MEIVRLVKVLRLQSTNYKNARQYIIGLYICTLFVTVLLVGCGGGSSGGGGGLNLTGTWRVFPSINTPGVTISAFTTTLAQDGANVTSTSFQADPLPPNLVSCGGNDSQTNLSGAVSGNQFNGVVNSNISTTNFSVTGSNNSLSGTFTINIFSGICVGTYRGTLTMTRT